MDKDYEDKMEKLGDIMDSIASKFLVDYIAAIKACDLETDNFETGLVFGNKEYICQVLLRRDSGPSGGKSLELSAEDTGIAMAEHIGFAPKEKAEEHS